MEFIKVFRKAGEPTAAAPIYLCEQAKQHLSIWRDQSVNEIYERVNRLVSEVDRYEFLSVENGIVKGMMIICIEQEEIHTGKSMMFTKLAFTPLPGTLREGYKAMKRLAKELNVSYIHFSRHPTDTLRKVKK